MRAGILFALLLVLLASHTTDAWLRSVTRYIRDKCTVGTAGLNCALNGRKRGVDQGGPSGPGGPGGPGGPDDLCGLVGEVPAGVSMGDVAEAFNAANTEGDDNTLNRREFRVFLEEIRVIDYCAARQGPAEK